MPSISPDTSDVVRLIEARHHDPFAVLGRHRCGGHDVVRAFQPRTRIVCLDSDDRPMERIGNTDLFEFSGDVRGLPTHYRFIIEADDGCRRDFVDPYSFVPLIDLHDIERFNAGKHFEAQCFLGAHPRTFNGVSGVLFGVWAPNAERVSVVGDFNGWDGRCHPMRRRGLGGVWELFIPGLDGGAYKFEIRQRTTGNVLQKSDPYARWTERRPATASLIAPKSEHHWNDADWLRRRAMRDWMQSPVSTYEVHLGSWRRDDNNEFLGYRDLARQLARYTNEIGFTHIELMPISEHPLDESWGYQTTGYFSPTSRFGRPDDFRWFVDHCHQQNKGVFLDWVPAHFPRDEHALANFDGTALYEYHDPRKAEHKDWGTLVFNYERNEVRSFLISSALYWLREFHLDGLRVDAVASMLYLNFSRQAEDWVPNRLGGNQNLEAVDFLCELNDTVRRECPDCLMMAEESSDWHGVTAATSSGGLGFHLKWNMGWMHDTLNYFAKDPIHRKHHQNWLTFGPTYAYNENSMLSLSHDEVVHLKRSLLGKMPGDEWQQLANLRLLLTYQWVFPGKILLFMGAELAQPGEWNAGATLPWDSLQQPGPRGISILITELNRLQLLNPALSHWDCDSRGFEWLDGDDSERSVIVFMRHAPDSTVIVALNFTPIIRYDYRIGVPVAGCYGELLNSDAGRFGGSDVLNAPQIGSEEISWHDRDNSIAVTLPPLGALLLHKIEDQNRR